MFVCEVCQRVSLVEKQVDAARVCSRCVCESCDGTGMCLKCHDHTGDCECRGSRACQRCDGWGFVNQEGVTD